jgi:hypothetical protein
VLKNDPFLLSFPFLFRYMTKRCGLTARRLQAASSEYSMGLGRNRVIAMVTLSLEPKPLMAKATAVPTMCGRGFLIDVQELNTFIA